MPGWLTTFLNQEETRLKQEVSRERQHAEELQILRDLLTPRENNNQMIIELKRLQQKHRQHLDHHYWR